MLDPQLNPFAEIQTERLLLRQITMGDAPDLFELRTDPQVLSYLDREPPQAIDEIYALIDQIDVALQNNEGISWGICLKDCPHVIGTIGFWRIDKINHRGEIGYMLKSGFWRQGITNEAMAAVLGYGFSTLKLHSIEANINPLNTASRNLLENYGFVQEAYFKENYYARGQFLDSVILSLLSSNFRLT